MMGALIRFIKNVLVYLTASLLIVFTVFPFFWIILISFRDKTGIFSIPPRIIPDKVTLDNYIYAVTHSKLLTFTVNSLTVTLFTILCTISIATLGAYAVSRLEFKGKKYFFALLGSTQIFPGVIVLIPMYMMCRSAHLYNTLTSLVIAYTAGQVPVAIVLLMGYLKDIPHELEDASKIDGCSRLGTIFRIIIPLARPGIVATAIFTFVNIWQEYMLAVSFLGKISKFTLTVGLSSFNGQHSTEWGPLMATAVTIAIPALIAFVSVQNHFINNLSGAVKE